MPWPYEVRSFYFTLLLFPCSFSTWNIHRVKQWRKYDWDNRVESRLFDKEEGISKARDFKKVVDQNEKRKMILALKLRKRNFPEHPSTLSKYLVLTKSTSHHTPNLGFGSPSLNSSITSHFTIRLLFNDCGWLLDKPSVHGFICKRFRNTFIY